MRSVPRHRPPIKAITFLPLLVLGVHSAPVSAQTVGSALGAQTRASAPLWASLTPGSYAVGFHAYWLYDRSRTWLPGTLPDGRPSPEDPARPVRLMVWYPALASLQTRTMRLGDYEGGAMTPGFEADERRITQADFGDSASGTGIRGLRRSTSAFEQFMRTPTPAHQNASAAKGHFPVLLYALGQGDHTLENTVLCEYLASQGYVVVSVPQLGTSPRRTMFVHDPPSYEAQVRDLAFALATVVRDYPSADSSRVGAIGMSMGGIYALILAVRNSQVRTVIGLDPSYIDSEPSYYFKYWQAPEFDAARFRGHWLTLYRGTSRTAIVDSLRYADRLIVHVPNTIHVDYTSYPVYMMNVPLAEQDSSAIAVRSPQAAVRAYVAIVEYVRCYLDTVLAHRADHAACDAIPGATVEHLGASQSPTEEDLYDILHAQGLGPALSEYESAAQRARNGLPLRRDVMYRIVDELGYDDRAHEAAEYAELTSRVFADADAYEHLGDAWADAHDAVRARSAYERALVLDPRRASARQKLDRLKVP
jgi:dienelactone hydrolase